MLKQPVPSLSRWIGRRRPGRRARRWRAASRAWSAQPTRAVVSHDVSPPPPATAARAADAAGATLSRQHRRRLTAIPPAAGGCSGVPRAASHAGAGLSEAQALAQHDQRQGRAADRRRCARAIRRTWWSISRNRPACSTRPRSTPPGNGNSSQPVKDGQPVAGRISVPVQFESRGNPDRAGRSTGHRRHPAPSARG